MIQEQFITFSLGKLATFENVIYCLVAAFCSCINDLSMWIVFYKIELSQAEESVQKMEAYLEQNKEELAVSSLCLMF